MINRLVKYPYIEEDKQLVVHAVVLQTFPMSNCKIKSKGYLKVYFIRFSLVSPKGIVGSEHAACLPFFRPGISENRT